MALHKKMNPMVSLELTDEEKHETLMPIPMDRPDYPFGLRICLTDREMEKMDVDPAEACVGGLVHLHAMARITSVSSDERDGKKCCRVEMQIEDMCIEGEDAENEAVDRSESLYTRTKK